MRKRMLTKQQRGFSLIELVVVMSIIVLLSGVGFVSYTNANKASRDAKRKSDIEQIRAALEMYRTEEGSYPSTLGQLGSSGYLPNYERYRDPKDTNLEYTYRTSSLSAACTGRKYEVCTNLEVEGSAYCVCNP